jgi:hypothetical protein
MRKLRHLLVLLTPLTMSLSAAFAQASNYTFTQIASVTDYAGYFESGTLTNRGEVLFAPARSIRPIAKAFSSGAKEC